MVLFRRLLGDVLREPRMQRGMTLRELSAEARVSLGYISEIERGQKEASSELLASLCQAMDLPLSDVLRDVADAVSIEEAAMGVVVSTSIDVGRRAATWSPPPPDPTGGPGSALGLAAGTPVGRALATGSPSIVTAIGVRQRRQAVRSRR